MSNYLEADVSSMDTARRWASARKGSGMMVLGWASSETMDAAESERLIHHISAITGRDVAEVSAAVAAYARSGLWTSIVAARNCYARLLSGDSWSTITEARHAD